MEYCQPCSDTSDLTDLSHYHHLYLKPEAKLSITVALPSVRLPGKTISNWEVMERLRQAAQPEEFQVIKVSKSTLEFIRFDVEIENRTHIRAVISKLDGKFIRLSGFPEPLKVRAAEAKPEFPTRHDWDRYFRDAKNMNEMKPGERPDTVHLQGLPSKWFINQKGRKSTDPGTPSETILQQVFEAFGDVRCVDVPAIDPYRSKMKASISGIRTFSHATDTLFEAYVQYREYICFVKAMDCLRGMKLVFKDGEKAYSASIKVDFDKTKHLSDMSIRRRAVEREKLMAKERELEEGKRREEEAVKRALEAEEFQKQEEKRLKGERRKEREEKRKQKILKKLKKKEAEQMNIKIAIEERKLLMAQRKLESIRLLDELFERVKIDKQKEITRRKEFELSDKLSKVKMKNEGKQRKREEKESIKNDKLLAKEKQLRKRLVNKIKCAQEQQMEERREKLRKTIEGKYKIKSKDGSGESDHVEHYEHPGYDRNLGGYDPYPGYSFGDWAPRGGFRGRYFPRRPYRGIRPYRNTRGGYHGEWWPPNNSDWSQLETKKEKKSGADDMEDVSSDSSATSEYSKLGSSSDEKRKEAGKSDGWPGYEGGALLDGLPPSHPWVGYSDYYNPRFIRRGPRRAVGSYRGWTSRGGFGAAPNPNVPMNSFYMQSINSQYYRYFNRLAKGENKSSRSRSNSSERVVCRKVLSRSRSRGKSYSKTPTRSRSHSKSRSRSSSKAKSRSRSRSRSRSKPNSRRSSKERPSSSKSNKRKGEQEDPGNEVKQRSSARDIKDNDVDRTETGRSEKEFSDLSLSLSGSDDWSRGSPERKAKPLGDPNWEPSDRRYRRGRSFGGFDRFPPFRFEVRSHVTRADRSRSRERPSRRQEVHRSREREDVDRRSHRSRSRGSPSHRRSLSRNSRSEKSREKSPKTRGDKRSKSDKGTEEASTSKGESRSHSSVSKSKHKKDKKKKSKSHEVKSSTRGNDSE